MPLTAEQKLKRAIANLDKAVHNYYKEVDPEDEEQYASCHFRNYIEDGTHTSVITLCIKGEYIDIRSNKDTIFRRNGNERT